MSACASLLQRRLGVSSRVSIGELCTKRPLAVSALRALGVVVDDPSASTASICVAHALEEASVEAAIFAEEQRFAAAWHRSTLATEIDAIVATYHEPFSREVHALASTFGIGLPIWETPLALVEELRVDFMHHIDMEERALFPLLGKGGSSVLVSIRALSLEHDDLMLTLLAIGNVVRGCVGATPELASDATVAFERFERFVCEAIHVESNVLFPRVLELARR